MAGGEDMRSEKIQEFSGRKFGMFLHWGLYAVPGGRWRGQVMDYIGEWIQSKYRIPNREYAALAREFNPVRFDAAEWMEKAAAAGMKYIVYTAKHHEGFAMYHSKVSEFNIVDATPFRRDPLAELAQECRKRDMGVGIYYSQNLDWHEPDGGDSGPDFPRNIGDMSWGNDWDFPDRKRKNYENYFRSKVLPQVTELLTNYGPVEVIWFDCPLNMEERFCRELCEHVRRLQPDCLINSRIGHDYGDYDSYGDNQTPGAPSARVSEMPGTLNDTWGFKFDDHNWKTPEQVIEQLAMLAEQNANYLLNIGPRPDGAFPEEADRILRAVADWYRENGDGISRSTGTPFRQNLDFACCTMTGRKLHFFLKKTGCEVTLSGVETPVARADVPFRQSGDLLTLELPSFEGRFLPEVTLEFADVPRISRRLCPQGGELKLIPSTAKLLDGSGISSCPAGREVNAAGETREETRRCRLELDGTLSDWQRPESRIQWELFFPESGTFRISVVTRNRMHSAPWTGEREIELAWGTQIMTGRLRPDRRLSDAYYATAETELGELTVSGGESGTLSLRTTGIFSEDALQMNLVCVRLTCEKDHHSCPAVSAFGSSK